MITANDKTQLLDKGISEAIVGLQLNRFKQGFPYLKLSAAASIEQGIIRLNEQEINQTIQAWNNYLEDSHRILKFVPASGAASRMFKDLFAFLDASYEIPTTSFEKKFFTELESFAFYDTLNNKAIDQTGKDLKTLTESRQYKRIVELLLLKDGLRYGELPKGVLQFHKYENQVRTAFEEHLVEGILYAKQKNGTVNIHFTVSEEHQELFNKLLNKVVGYYETRCKVKYNISFSVQKTSTDTIAVNMDNTPFREDNGELLFRPGGHGALIENLNDLESEIIFIKNIDNVVPDHLKNETVRYKQVIAGVLVDLQKQIFAHLEKLNSGKYTHAEVLDILQFVQKKLFCKNPETKKLEDSELAIYLIEKLNRPIRVCGMVKNVGEPGGGPFLAYNSDGTISPQILESSQIDTSNETYKKMFTDGTHFNPVDLVCGVYNYKGEKFDLLKYVDQDTGFISEKSKNGKDLKALELPGLWNGAMSNWNTIFVEVPLITFNPVKTVNDLLRPEHQP